MSLKQIQEALCKETFGITKAEASTIGCCVNCRKPVVKNINGETFIDDTMLRNALEVKEYGISGLCGVCWDEIMGVDTEAVLGGRS